MAEPILLVDREANRRRLLQRRLARRGLEVVSAGSLAEATQVAPAVPAVLLVDLGLFSAPDGERLDDLLRRAADRQVFACSRCGRTVRELVSGAAPERGALWCCGAPMRSPLDGDGAVPLRASWHPADSDAAIPDDAAVGA